MTLSRKIDTMASDSQQDLSLGVLVANLANWAGPTFALIGDQASVPHCRRRRLCCELLAFSLKLWWLHRDELVVFEGCLWCVLCRVTDVPPAVSIHPIAE